MSRHAVEERRRSRAAAAVALGGLALLGLAVLGAGALLLRASGGGSPDYAGSGSGSAVVQVHRGDTAGRIGRALVAAGVVKSAAAFRDAARDDSRSAALQPGLYQLRRGMSARSALARMLDPSSRLLGHVALPEGLPLNEALRRFSTDAKIPITQLRAVAAQPGQLGLPPYATGLEGYLFPATYEVQPDTSARDALAQAVTRFRRAARDVDLEVGAKAVGRSPADVVVIASLLESEAKAPEDYARVARVIYNRLAARMPLQLDSTVNYALGRRNLRVSEAQTRAAPPYNTYAHPGLPPTPIDSPGERALRAALHPAPGDWLYFVLVDKAGHSAFTRSYDDFLRLKEKAQRDGVY